ncbi:MAG TPA: phosphoribosylamine--glycine ligase [Acidimicrobiales bacterium]|jgi:phosphoribosylamine--glycine ligase
MRVCIAGGKGGREHALGWWFARAGHDVVVAPGNPGIPWATLGDPVDERADLFVLADDASVVGGLGDRLRARGELVFGPGADGGRLEGSKAWMKDLLVEGRVPTARHGSFTDLGLAEAFLRTLPGPYVVKTDYLAEGKGVLVTADLDEAVADATAKLDGGGIVVEEAMTGPEISLFAVCDGSRFVRLPVCQDHKRIGDGDTGPNTGGMGAYSPVPFASAGEVDRAFDECVEPTLEVLRARGIDYRGVLYTSVMLTPEGPKVIEHNVRFGDPECQVLVRLVGSDPYDLLASAAAGELAGAPRITTDACVVVSLAAEGYPGTPRRGDLVEGLDAARTVEGVELFMAGVDAEGRTAGGRVIHVSALGPNLAEAHALAYEAVDRISWPGMQHRRDIAAQAFRSSTSREVT